MIFRYQICVVFAAFFISIKPAASQTFYGYQTIGKHTVFFTLAIRKDMASMGLGYNRRIFGKEFTDVQAELLFPMNRMYSFKNFEVVAGAYKPNRLKRTWIGMGGHLRWSQIQTGANQSRALKLALTAIPSYTYTTSLTDGPYGTAGFRLGAINTLWSLAKNGANVSGGSFHSPRIEYGLHADLLLERTLGLSVNAWKEFAGQKKSSVVKNSFGNFYFGSGY